MKRSFIKIMSFLLAVMMAFSNIPAVVYALELEEVEGIEEVAEETENTELFSEITETAEDEGKTVSILGDSISTFSGYIPAEDGVNLEHATFYPNSAITSVEQTWWMQVITEFGFELGINESWSGSRVINTIDGNSGNLGEDAAMASNTRIKNLGSNGTPDIILFFGGTNDIAFGSPIGSFNAEDAPSEVDTVSTKWESYADAYTDAIMRMQYYYPDAEIIAVFPTENKSYYDSETLKSYNTVMAAICDHYGIKYIDPMKCGFTTNLLADVTHPSAEGHKAIAGYVINLLNESADKSESDSLKNTELYFTANSDAALYLRSQMIAREPSVTLRLYGATASAEASAILSKAWEHTGVSNEGDYIRHNQIGCDYTVTTGEDENGAYGDITYTFNWLTTAQQEAEVDAEIDAILAELDLWEKTDYEKIKGAYDWITENVQYDFDNEDNDEYELCHSTYAAVVQRIAVCQGYATLLYRMMLELGIDCRYIRGDAGYVEIEAHAWNIVKLEGLYYNMDPTWDRDLLGYYRMFLCTESNITEHHPDTEYLTDEWKANYPMAVVPYVFNVAASGKLSNGIEWVLDGDTGTLTVAGKGAIPNYRNNRAPWYAYRENVQSIVISEGITEVGERAFYWCTNCTSLTLPESLTAIREYGFNNLRALENVTLPSKLKTIEFCAFSECVALKKIVIPDSVTNCGSSAFSNCYGLLEAIIGKGLKQIPNSMFFGDRNLESVTLPEGLTYIGDTAFSDCGLFNFTIPATLTGLGSSVFGGCRRLSEFYVESGNQYYKAVDGVLFTKDGKTLVAYSMGDISSYYYVPAGTEVIARSAFNDSYRLQYIYFPDSLKVIEPYAFAYCEVLWAVTFTPNITRIGDSAFRSCVGLYRAMFKNPDVILESAVFANCDTMEDITLPANLKEIPGSLFYDCARLAEVEIPKTVTRIGSSAFLNCDSLKTITVPGNVKTVEQQAFDYCDKLETLTFEEGVQTIGWLAIRKNPALKKVVLPSSITYFENKGSEDRTFDDCPKMVAYVKCGTTAYNYAVSRNVAKSVSHPYTNATVVSPTCTAQGYTKNYCKCGTYSYNSNYTSALGHSYSSKVTSPTCTAQGYTTYTCRRCSYSYNANYTSALGHSLVLENYVAPTCTAQGYSGDEVCSVCGTTYYGEVTPANGHSYEAVVTAPTCTEQGYTTHSCYVCEDSYIDSYVDAKGHTEVIDPAVEATCTETGLTEGRHCSVCEEILVEQKEVSAKGHNYETVITEPTCTEQGYTTYTCSVCDDSYVDSYVDAKGHVFGNWAVTKEATCEEKGTERRDCESCEHYETREIAAKGHAEVIDSAVAPTCTETGLTEGKHCSVCEKILVKQEVVSAKGHKYEAVITEPTCTEQGYTTYKCSCGESYVDNYVDATGHSFGDWYETKAPAATEKGEERRDCQKCDFFETRETEELGIFGDTNSDGKINVIDANLIRRYAASLLEFDEKQLRVGDVNGDGEIDVMDASYIRRFAVKLITKFPIEEK
ncbi:MAG: leucine-rich repeat protein [Oscillospiraceae bacterium]|nr:leucine-rich repeat protein [Oscillospiraceae bacterium]